MPDKLRRLLWRLRFPLAAVCLGLATALVVAALRPPPPPTRSVVVLSRDAAPGQLLADDDVAVARLPPAAVPDLTLDDPVEATGSRLAVGLPAGTPLSPAMLVGPGLVAGAPAGTVVVPVPLADAGSAGLARPGTRVDLLATPGDGLGASGPAQVVAAGVLVLAVVTQGTEAGLLGGGDSGPTTLYVAAGRRDATEIVGASAWTPLRVVLTAP